jgi:hypothetical protein
MKVTVTILSLLLSMTYFVMAGEKMSDAAIKQKLVGYWRLSDQVGRHHVQAPAQVRDDNEPVGCQKRNVLPGWEPLPDRVVN